MTKQKEIKSIAGHHCITWLNYGKFAMIVLLLGIGETAENFV